MYLVEKVVGKSAVQILHMAGANNNLCSTPFLSLCGLLELPSYVWSAKDLEYRKLVMKKESLSHI